MYTFSNRLKLTAIILIIVGIIGIGVGFFTTPKSVEEVKQIVANDHHSDIHSQDAHHGDAHYEHILHQLQNKPWASVYVAALFFLLISLGVLAFYAINRAAQAGWSPVLFRVMEAITAYLFPGAVIFYTLLVLSGLHVNHLFIWMDEAVVAKDALLQGKQSYLNVPMFLLRSAIYLLGWIAYRYISRRLSLREDNETDNKSYVKNFKWSAGFLVFFLVTESMMSWDWIMSVDPHWFSTLFGWYVFASLFVSAITTIALVTIYLKSRGYLENVNSSHLHDLAKFMFAISIFWTYLWFSQFLLIWYANIPEETVYYVSRIFSSYRLPFLGMLVLNFVFPLLVLVSTDAKRIGWLIFTAGIVILIGHYIDFYMMIMPATVGDKWSFGITEISSVLFFAGLFIFVVFNALTKAPLLAKGNPLIEESKHFHY